MRCSGSGRVPCNNMKTAWAAVGSPASRCSGLHGADSSEMSGVGGLAKPWQLRIGTIAEPTCH